jgi:hypothetical protein
MPQIPVENPEQTKRLELLRFIRYVLETSPNALKQGLSGEEFARELAKGAEVLQKYIDQGIID